MGDRGNPEIAIKRLMLRNQISRKRGAARINSQLTNQERAAKADVIITNNGSTEEFFQSQQVLGIKCGVKGKKESKKPTTHVNK